MTQRSVMRTAILFIGIILVISMTSVSAETNPQREEKVATVNGEIILKKEFVWAVSSAEQRMVSSGKMVEAAERKILEKDTLEELISQELLFQESKIKGIIVLDSEVDAAYENLIASIPRDIDMGRMNEEMGLKEADIKREFLRAISIQKMLDRELVYDKFITEREVKNYYDSNPDKFVIPGPVRAAHILIQVDPDFTPEQRASAKERISAIKKRLDSGEDFSELAKKFSEGPSSVKGGDLGFFNRGQMVRAFEDAVFELEQGQVSGIVETQFGYHLIKLFEKAPEKLLDYDDVKDRVEEYLKEEKINQAQRMFVRKLKERAVIEMFMGN